MQNIPKTLVIDLSDNINAGATKIVDVIALSQFSAIEYFVNMKVAGPTKNKFLKILVSRTETDVETQVYARRGDQIDIAIDAFVSGLNAELRITNNELVSLEIAATRILT
jgi:hypothetical protein